jgi:type II secretory ATPase GspE/PulE/Tfp pilus assembly ATPase PilB-like protein
MGIEGFLVSSSLIGVLAQRLVRVICLTCKEPYTPQQEIVDKIPFLADTVTYYGAGCDTCRGTGYRGRTGVFELMVTNDEIRRLILERASSDKIRQEAMAGGMQILRDSGLQKVKEGVTTIEEVLRVAQEGA